MSSIDNIESGNNESRLQELLQRYRKLSPESQKNVLDCAMNIADRMTNADRVPTKITTDLESEYNKLANRAVLAIGDERPPTTYEINIRDILTDEEFKALDLESDSPDSN